MEKAKLWKPLKDKKVQCELCNHYCIIEFNQRGKCGVRVNKKGALYSLVYDKISAINVDPIEKKPLYHFYPGSSSFSIGTMGCNFSCTFCQNYTLSQPPKFQDQILGESYSPEKLVEMAKEYDCKSISYTYSEPTIFFELVIDTSKKAKEEGILNVLVSNGFMSDKCLEELKDIIDAINVDLKSFSESFYKDLCDARLKPVLKNIEKMKKMGWWVEITTLIIPNHNDDEKELKEIAQFIFKNLGAETPWHISRFHPAYHLLTPPITPYETLKKAFNIGKEIGLKYVYIGNVPRIDEQNTYCPQCGQLLIKREGFFTEIKNLKNGKCSKCNTKIEGVGLP